MQNTTFKLIVCLVVSGAFLVSSTFAETAVVLVNEESVEYLGGVPSLDTKNAIDGKLTIATDRITFTSKKGEFQIDPEKITFMSGGQFAKRRLKSALVGTILLSPLFLFALIGKKKRDIVVIEYSDQKGKTAVGEEPKLSGAATFRYNPKGGRSIAIENALERVAGMKIEKNGGEDEKAEDEGEDTKAEAKE